MRVVHIVARCVAFALVLVQAPGVTAQDFVIGVIAGLTGAGASYGRSIVQGAEMAVREVNAAGGVNGRQLRLRIVDDGSEPARSAIVMRRLVSESPDLIVGGWGSAQVLAHLDFPEQSGIPYIVVGATNPRIVTKLNHWVFRVVQSDDLLAGELARQTRRLGLKRIAVIHDRNAYGSGSRDSFVKALKSLGLAPAEIQSYDTTDTDFRPQLEKSRGSMPDALAIFGTVPAAPAIMNQARAMEIQVRFIGTDGLANDALIAGAGKSAEGTLLMGTYHEDVDPEVSVWSRRFRAQNHTGQTLNPAGAVKEYAAIRDIAVPCLRKAAADVGGLRDCIAGWSGTLLGVAGETRFGENGQLAAPPIPIEIRQGAFHLLRSTP